MARFAALGLTFLFAFRTAALMMVQGGLIPLVLLAVTALAQRCTRAVPVHRQPATKKTIFKRIPSSCSNWDKTWAWLTQKDCNTKYRWETVVVPPSEVTQYKLQTYCCDGADKCEEAENRQSTTFDSSDTKFLAVVLGSTAACIVIVIIIFAITFYTKKTRCSQCNNSHAYTSAGESSDGEDSREDSPVEDKVYPVEGRTRHESARSGRERGSFWDSDTDHPEGKGAGEAVYAEIGDPEDAQLPRYADIFREGREEGSRASEARRTGKAKRSKKENPNSDPFTNASAPPLYTEVSKSKRPVLAESGNGCKDKGKCTDAYVNAPNAIRAPPTLKTESQHACVRDGTEVRVVQPAVHTSCRVSDGSNKQKGRPEATSRPSAQVKEEGRIQNDPKYYNVQEKKKKKQRKPSGGSGNSVVAGGKQQKAMSNIRSGPSNTGVSNASAAGAKGRVETKTVKASGATAVAMEMSLSKSCSASETMAKVSPECSETSLSRSQKRRSAPPGSTLYENQNLAHPSSHHQTNPDPPQSAAPPRPSTISNSVHTTDTTKNIPKSNNTCSVIYEAQAPLEKEKKVKRARKSISSSLAPKPSNSANSMSDISEKQQAPASSPHNYENANLVSLMKSKGEKVQHTTHKHKSTGGSAHISGDQIARPTSLTPITAPGQQERQASDAAVLNLSPSSVSPSATFSLAEYKSAGSDSGSHESIPTSSLPSPMTGESNKVNSSPANTYDKLNFEENSSLSGKSHSPNTHVYQSLDSAGHIGPASSISCDKDAETLVVDNKLDSQRLDGSAPGDSTLHSSNEEQDCDSPPPSLPPRCPIAASKRAVDGLTA